MAHLDVSFVENFHVAGGLFANVQKGSNFHFEQALVNNELWLPVGSEGTFQARVLPQKMFVSTCWRRITTTSASPWMRRRTRARR